MLKYDDSFKLSISQTVKSKDRFTLKKYFNSLESSKQVLSSYLFQIILNLGKPFQLYIKMKNSVSLSHLICR